MPEVTAEVNYSCTFCVGTWIDLRIIKQVLVLKAIPVPCPVQGQASVQ